MPTIAIVNVLHGLGLSGSWVLSPSSGTIGLMKVRVASPQSLARAFHQDVVDERTILPDPLTPVTPTNRAEGDVDGEVFEIVLAWRRRFGWSRICRAAPCERSDGKLDFRPIGPQGIAALIDWASRFGEGLTAALIGNR